MKPPNPQIAGPRRRSRKRMPGAISLVCFLLAALGSLQPAAAQSDVRLAVHPAAAGDTIHIVVGRSVALTSAAPLRRVYVGNPPVLETYTSGLNEVVITAKAAGVSSLVLWDDSGNDRLYTVIADIDPAALRNALSQAFPGSLVQAEAVEGRIVLTGSVGSEAASDAASKMASLYAKDVVNSLRVIPVHGKQVQLKLRIVEVDRTKLDQMGMNIFAGGRTAVATTTEQYPTTVTGSGSTISITNPLDILLYNSKLNVGLTLQDLEQKQVLQVLAEPTLTTLSGLPARFLSGGEFPFPVVEGGTSGAAAITIQFRPYGVKVDFTPTVNQDGTIRLKLSPEVSTLDYSNAVTISGFTIPAISTRRAETEVEIKDGQSFVVSGLLDHRTTDMMSKVPGISSIPLLGQIFKSKNLNHSVTELVIVVTATVVDPLTDKSDGQPYTPKFVVPNLDSNGFDNSVQGRSGAQAPAKPQAQPAAPGHQGVQ